MKKSFLVMLLPILCASCQDEQPKLKNKDLLPTSLVNNPRSAEGTDTAALNGLATMEFRDTVFDFGTIKEGAVVTHDFEFKNTGREVLLISNASASCGCTVADYPHAPLEPGKSATVKVQFNAAGKQGHQEKSVALTTNSIRGVHTLYIKGDVTPEKK